MNIISKPSPNFTLGRKIYKPEAIVIHIMQGTLAGTDNWFSQTKAKVSAHYGVGRNGEVHRYVDEQNTAWHAGVISTPSWSFIKKAGNYYVNPNYYTIGIEHEGTVDSEWTEAMYDSTSTLIAEISKRWCIPIDRNHVIGHHEIYAVKACPGIRLDFNKLIALALNKSVPQVAQNIPKKANAPTQVLTKVALNIRSQPNTNQPPVKTVQAGTTLTYVVTTEQGENIHGNSVWFQTSEGHWFWSGGVK